MGSSLIQMGIFIGLVTMLCPGTRAQSGCTNVLLSMAPCLNYVTGASSSPSSSCCSQLASVVKSQPQCLCSALSGGGSSLGISINQTLALELPKACNVQTPPVSQCNAANGPAASPVSSPEGAPEDSSNEAPASPTDSSNEAPASPTSSSASDPTTSSSVSAGSKSTGTTSDGSTVKMPLMFITFLLFMASYASVSSSF